MKANTSAMQKRKAGHAASIRLILWLLTPGVVLVLTNTEAIAGEAAPPQPQQQPAEVASPPKVQEPEAKCDPSSRRKQSLAERKDVLLLEDFEKPDYRSHWTEMAKEASLSGDAKRAFQGKAAKSIRCTAGKHVTNGWSYFEFPKGVEKIHVRLYLCLPTTFSMGTCDTLKLFAIGGRPPERGPWAGWAMQKAGVVPNGRDRFNGMLFLKKDLSLGFYYYNPDQKGIYGAARGCDLGAQNRLQLGKWHCVDFMAQANGIGRKDGMLRCWLDGEMVGEVKDIRFRDVDDLQIREMALMPYWGGDGPTQTSPVDQEFYIDDLVVAREYVGPAGSNRQRTGDMP